MKRKLLIQTAPSSRKGAILVLSALLMIVVLALAAFAIDIGYMMLVRTQLQLAADAGAMAAGNSLNLSPKEIEDKAAEYVAYHSAGADKITRKEVEVELGTWDATTNTFIPGKVLGNAVRVTARRDGANFFFGRVLGQKTFDMEASSVAMANPRDIAFVVDLSGSMNDDTEPAWGTSAITSEFSSQGFPNAGTDLMKNLYADFGYGAFPGTLEWVGQPFGIKKDKWAYSELTKDDGPLGNVSLLSKYRILPIDTEAVRKKKAYSWMIDNQIAKIMPKALPTPDSNKNYAYWEKYLDYIMEPVTINPPAPPAPPKPPAPPAPPKPPTPPAPPAPPKPPTPPIGRALPGGEPTWAQIELIASSWSSAQPSRISLTGPRAALISAAAIPFEELLFAAVGSPPTTRGTIPPSQDGDRIDKFNNPNNSTFPKAKISVPQGFRNKIGYQTYVQFMMDHGRDLKPDDKTFVPLSYSSPDCPLQSDTTVAGKFTFPPREQPMHASRRALIAAMKIVEDRNKSVPSISNRDQVSLVTFDTLSGKGPQILQPLTGDYRKAMQACTTMQAVGDKGNSTATEPGLSLANKHLQSKSGGGMGRDGAEKVIVLLTDGVPNAYSSSNATIDKFMAANPSSDYYGGGYYWYDAPLIQAMQMEAGGTSLYPVGIGLGTEHGFMDRLARQGGTANGKGQSARGSGNPTEYEQQLTDIFEKIIKSPTARLVQ